MSSTTKPLPAVPATVLSAPARRKPTVKPNSKTPESRVVAAVKAWAAAKPDVYLARIVQAGTAGTPDLLLCIRGRFVGVECKAPGAKPRGSQMRHGQAITAAHGIFIWGDADALLPELERIYEDSAL